jgi:hypothetical protein
MVEWSSSVDREFQREPLTATRAVSLATKAIEDGRQADAERLISIAFELFDLAATTDDELHTMMTPKLR